MVIGHSFDEHLKYHEEVLGRLRNPNLKLNPKKCSLFQKKVEFLDYAVCEK